MGELQGRLEDMNVQAWTLAQQVDYLAVRSRFDQHEFMLTGLGHHVALTIFSIAAHRLAVTFFTLVCVLSTNHKILEIMLKIYKYCVYFT